MNCETMKNRVLLEHSGELSWWGKLRLRSHLSRCAACRAFQNELFHLTDAVRSVRWDEGFAPQLDWRVWAVTPRRERAAAVSWHPAFAYAALSVLLAFAFVLVLRPFQRPMKLADTAPETEVVWDADLDDRIAALDGLLSGAGTDWSDIGTVSAENGDLDSIARQLLVLEGEQI